MKTYEKIKEMNLEEMTRLIKALIENEDYLYCEMLCPYRNNEDICINAPCLNDDSLHEILNADYETIINKLKEEGEIE